MRLVVAVVFAGSVSLTGVRPSPAQAQALVSGTVRDSLSWRPFANATIELVPAATPWLPGFTTRSDSAGRYSITAVPAGRYLFGFQHPRLDSLGMDAVAGTLEVRSAPTRVTADLALPSARTFARALCGANGGDTSGVLVGRVLDAASGVAVSQGTVQVQWGEVFVGGDGAGHGRRQLTATVGADGRYVACNVPTDVPMTVQAHTGTTLASGEIEVAFAYDMPFLHKDILVGATRRDASTVSGESAAAPTSRGSARLTTRVLRDDGAPVVGARVRVPVADVQAVTDSTGVAQLRDLPAGSHSVEVTALGFAPMRGSADLRPDADAITTLRASRTVPTLDAVTVRSARERDFTGFYERRAKGNGYFVDSDQLRKWGVPTLDNALAMAPGLRKGAGRGGCPATFFIDGQRIDYGLNEVLNGITIGGVEVYADPAAVPARFTSGLSGNCAVIIVWTTGFVL